MPTTLPEPQTQTAGRGGRGGGKGIGSGAMPPHGSGGSRATLDEPKLWPKVAALAAIFTALAGALAWQQGVFDSKPTQKSGATTPPQPSGPAGP